MRCLMYRKLFVVLVFTLIMFGTANAENQAFDFKNGFNFISFTIKPGISPQQLKQQNPGIEEIYTYSAASGSFLSVSEGSLTAFNYWKGYILKSNTALSLNLTGDPLQVSSDIILKSGFNLVGISKTSISLTFSTLMNKYPEIKGIYKWSNSSGSFIQVIKNLSNTPELIDGFDPTITAGQAYFINSDKDTTINIFSSTAVPEKQEIIESQSKAIPISGEKFVLKNGITLNVPANAVIAPAELTLSLIKDDAYNTTYQSVLEITMNAAVKNYVIDIPIKPGMTQKDVTVVLIPSSGDLMFLPGQIDEKRQVYSININESLMPIMKSPRYDSGSNSNTKNRVVIELHDISKWSVNPFNYGTNGIYEPIIHMPKYGQENLSCWAAAMLMLIKTYNLNPNEKTVYNILKKFGVEKNAGLHNVAMIYDEPYEKLIDSTLISNIGSSVAIEKPIYYNCENLSECVTHEILNGRPILLFMPDHVVIVCGFQKKKSEPEIKYIINNPATHQKFGTSTGNNQYYYECLSFDELNKLGGNKGMFKALTIKTSINLNRPLQTIQMPDFGKISFAKGPNYIYSTYWSNKGDEGYVFSKDYTIQDIARDQEIPDFDIINLQNIPIYNSFPYTKTTVKTRTSIYISNTQLVYQYPPESGAIITAEPGEFIFEQDQTSKYFVHYIKKAKFKTGWEKLGSDFLVKVELLNASGSVIDGFDFKFKYRSLFIVPSSSVNTNELKAPSTLDFIAKLVDETILSPDLFIWSVEPADGKVTINNGSVNISTGACGKYVVKAKYKENGAVHAGKEAVYEINVSSGLPQPGSKLTITPENPILYIGEEQPFTAKLDGLSTSQTVYYKWNCSAYQWYEGGSFSSDGPNCTYKAPNEAVGGTLRVYAKIGKDFSDPNDWTADYLVETNITVKKPEITILPNPISLGINEKVKFTATVTDNVKNYPLTWQLDNSLKGNISSDGDYDAPPVLASDKSETNIVIAKIGKCEGRANITINNVDIKIQQPILIKPNSVFTFSAWTEGAYNKDVEITASENTVTKKAPMSFEFTSPKYNELFYDDDAHITLKIKSLATMLEKTVTFVVARPRRKEIIEYHPGNINIKEKYEAIVCNELQFDNTIVEKFWFKHGFYEKYNTSGKTIIEGNYYLTKVSGKWTTYQDNGSIIDITTYKLDGGLDLYGSGVKHGYSAKYYDSGRIEWECNYTDNIINNEWKAYYDILNDNAVHRLKESGNYNNGLKTGTWLGWYETGYKKYEEGYTTYLDNTGTLVSAKNGTSTKWYDFSPYFSGGPLEIATYKNGVLDGPYTGWRVDDRGYNIVLQGNYTNGQKTGTWKVESQTITY